MRRRCRREGARAGGRRARRACRARPRQGCEGGCRAGCARPPAWPMRSMAQPSCRRTRRSASRSSAPIFAELDRLAAPDADPRVVDLDHRRQRLHRKSEGPAPLPGRPSGQPAASRAAGGAGGRAVDRARDRSPGQGDLRGGRPGADRGASARSRASSSTACRRCCCRRRSAWSGRLRHAAGSRQDAQGWAGPALVVHGAVRDHRAQRAGRHPGLLRAAMVRA